MLNMYWLCACTGIKYLVGSIPSFFAPAVSNASEAACLATCSCSQAHVDFLHAPLFSYQAGPRACTAACVLSKHAVQQQQQTVTTGAHARLRSYARLKHQRFSAIAKFVELRHTSAHATCSCAHLARAQACLDRVAADVLLQSDILRKYMAVVPRPGRSLLVISYLGVWTKARFTRGLVSPALFKLSRACQGRQVGVDGHAGHLKPVRPRSQAPEMHALPSRLQCSYQLSQLRVSAISAAVKQDKDLK